MRKRESQEGIIRPYCVNAKLNKCILYGAEPVYAMPRLTDYLCLVANATCLIDFAILNSIHDYISTMLYSYGQCTMN